MTAHVKRHLPTILVAMVTAAVTAGAPAIAHGVQHALFAHDSDEVDGRDAVGSKTSKGARAGKLVATSTKTGRLPNDIIKKAPDANRLDGLDSLAFLQNGSDAGGDLMGGYPNPQIGPDAISGPGSSADGTPEIADDVIGREELRTNSVDSAEIAEDAVGLAGDRPGICCGDEINDGSVGRYDLEDGAVAGSKLGLIVVRTQSVSVPFAGTEANGAYDTEDVEVICGVGERILSGGAYWDTSATTNDEELPIIASHFIRDEGLDRDGWHVRGGNDSGETRTLTAQALCLD